MENIFQIGAQVTGSSFIGRKPLTEQFRKWFLEGSHRVCKSIVGLTRIGKSSFVNHVFQDAPSDILLIKADLKEMSSFGELWQDMACTIDEYLAGHGLKNEIYSGCLKTVSEFESTPWIKFSRSLKNLFSTLARDSIRVIMVLDEFDHAETIFAGKTQYFEILRTLFSAPEFNISAILISRRSLHLIEGTTYQSSTFHGVLDGIHFSGFNDEDMEEYYAAIEKCGAKLTELHKSRIDYYAGRLPYLLSIIGHYILEDNDFMSGSDAASIDSLFMSKCKSINDYCGDCLRHLERDGDLKRIIPFVIGPNIGVTKRDKDELSALGYLRVRDDRLLLISEYLSRFLSLNMVNISIWDDIINFEKKLKQLISDEELATCDGLRLNDIRTSRDFLLSIPGINDSSVERYDAYINGNRTNFNTESTYLDVMSAKDAVKIISHFWTDHFAKYFRNDDYSIWQNRFESCAKARNAVAHGHEEYYTDQQRIEIDAFCKQVFDCLSALNRKGGKTDRTITDNAGDCVGHQSDNQAPSETRSDGVRQRTLNSCGSRRGQGPVRAGGAANKRTRHPAQPTVMLVEVTGQTNNKGLKGKPLGPSCRQDADVSFVKGSLPPTRLQLVGKKCRCRLTSYSVGNNTYTVEYIETVDE